jgi:hypothetical protein
MKFFDSVVDFIIAVGIKIWKWLMQKGVNKKDALLYLTSLAFFVLAVGFMDSFFKCLGERAGAALIYGILFLVFFIESVVFILMKYTLYKNCEYKTLSIFAKQNITMFFLFTLVNTLSSFDTVGNCILLHFFTALFIAIGQMIPDEPPKKKKEVTEKSRRWWEVFTPAPKPGTN